MRALLIVFIVLFGLTSCGFKLRGPVPLAPPLHNLYIQTTDPYGQLAHNLTQYLKSSGIHIASSAKEADTILNIVNEQTGQILLSVGGTQQTRQYNLTLSVTFQITNNKGIALILPQTLIQSRTIPIQSNQVLGGSNEANNLYRQMRQAIVYDMINRISSRDVTQILMKKTP